MQTWGIVDLVLMFVMWSVMMVAMMVPSGRSDDAGLRQGRTK
jgi:predicted metal-binding membrane protein